MAWLHIRYNSETLGMPVPMEVLLPQYIAGGTRRVDTAGPYPTLYLLHGMGDDHTAWMRRTAIERYVEKLPLALVMPAGYLGCYTDMAYGKNYFSFITKELPAICERQFPLSPRREDRFIAGNSMGGYGAMKAGLLASDTFAVAASFSGAMDIAANDRDIYNAIDPKLAGDVFGERTALRGGPNDLFAAAERLAHSDQPHPNFYMRCGAEDFLYPDNLRFEEHLQKLSLPLTFEEGQGDVQWKYWDSCIERLLAWLPLR